MSKLVALHGNEIYCDSMVVANKFGKRHANVLRSIRNILETEEEIKGLKNETLKFLKVEKEYRGQKYKV